MATANSITHIKQYLRHGGIASTDWWRGAYHEIANAGFEPKAWALANIPPSLRTNVEFLTMVTGPAPEPPEQVEQPEAAEPAEAHAREPRMVSLLAPPGDHHFGQPMPDDFYKLRKGKGGEETFEPDARRFAREIAVGRYACSYSDVFNMELLEVSEGLRLSRPNSSHRDRETKRFIGDLLEQMDTAVNTAPFRERVFAELEHEAPRVDHIEPFSHDPDEYCIARPIYTPSPGGEMPTWQSFLDRCSDPDAVAAWMYGVHSKKYVGRQSVWLCGPGQSGMSTAAKVFGEAFGAARCTVSNRDMKGDFAFAVLVGKYVLIYPDANNRRIYDTENWKIVASFGADGPVQVNSKNRDVVQVSIRCRMIITSNHEPAVEGKRYQMSRLLFVRVAPPTGELLSNAEAERRLAAEFPRFLHHAEQCYRARCPDNVVIAANETQQADLLALVRGGTEHFAAAYERHLVAETDPRARVSWQAIRGVLCEDKVHPRDPSGMHEDFYDWLVQQPGVVMKSHSRYRMLGGVRLKLGKPEFDEVEGDFEAPAEADVL